MLCMQDPDGIVESIDLVYAMDGVEIYYILLIERYIEAALVAPPSLAKDSAFLLLNARCKIFLNLKNKTVTYQTCNYTCKLVLVDIELLECANTVYFREDEYVRVKQRTAG